MVSNTMFFDSIVNATDLRKHQKRWLEEAYKKPVTINYGSKQLAIMNRDVVGKLYVEKHYSELIIKSCKQFINEGKNDIFPWVDNLIEEDRSKFHIELLNSAIKSIRSGNWDETEYLMQDWQATAEVESNPKLARILLTEENPSEYVEIED